MIRLAILFVLLVIGFYLGPQLAGEKGYVLIAMDNYTIELSVVSMGIIILLVFAALYLLDWLLRYTFGATLRTRSWLRDRRSRKARERTRAGQLALAEGDWRSAERLMLSGARHSESPVVNYLAAAEAAQEQGGQNRRDSYLQLAHRDGRSALAVGLTRARLQIRQGQFEQALATLSELRQKYPQNLQVLKLLQGLYTKLEDWEQLIALLPDLKRFKVLDDAQWLALQLEALQGQIARKSQLEGQKGLTELWEGLPRKLKLQSELVLAYAQALHQHGADSEAEAVLNEALKRERQGELLDLYGELDLAAPAEVLTQAELWLKESPDNAPLLSCLGKLSIRAEAWDKARSYLEQAIAIRPTRGDYALLGAVFEQENNAEAATAAYRSGAQLGV